MVKAAEKGNFEQWYAEDFMESTVYERWGERLESTRRYYASLRFCRPEALLANSYELVSRHTALSGRIRSEIGNIYCFLAIPKVFCYGTRSLSPESVAFLKENDLRYRAFEGATHLLMIEKPEEFYGFLLDCICNGIY